MVDESTPLTNGNDHGKNHVENIITSVQKNAGEAFGSSLIFVKEKTEMLQKMASNGHISLQENAGVAATKIKETTDVATTFVKDNAGAAAIKIKETTDVATTYVKDNAGVAATYVKEKHEMLQKTAKEGNMSIRLMAFIGGVAMVSTSFLSLFGSFFSLQFISLLICFYTFCFGLMICFLEGKSFDVPTTLSIFLRKYALFLDYVWGRGGLYFFAGSLQFSHLTFADMLVGGFMCFVGVMYILIGRSTAKKLMDIRNSSEEISEEGLKKKFNDADTDNTGKLDFAQFKTFIKELGVELDIHELHVTFTVADKDQDDLISYEDFSSWWAEHDFDSADSAPEFNV